MAPDTSTSSSQRYAPPKAAVADVAGDAGDLAGRGVRFAAAIIDGILMLGLFWLVARLTPLNIFSPRMAQAGFVTMLGMQLLGLLLFAAVNGWLLVTRGQTVGKRLLGIRIARPDGSAAPPGRVLGLRYGVFYLVAAIPVVGWLIFPIDALMIFRGDRRCLHDLIADTAVVKA